MVKSFNVRVLETGGRPSIRVPCCRIVEERLEVGSPSVRSTDFATTEKNKVSREVSKVSKGKASSVLLDVAVTSNSLLSAVNQQELSIRHVDEISHNSGTRHVLSFPSSLDSSCVEYHTRAELRGRDCRRDFPRVEVQIGGRSSAEQD